MFQSDLISSRALSPYSLPSIIIGILLFSLICLRFLLFPNRTNRGGKSEDQVIVLTGPMSSGKTKLWSRLVYGSDTIETMSSMVINSALIREPSMMNSNQTKCDSTNVEKRSDVTNTKVLTCIDTPAHPRLRAEALASHLINSNRVIFVIDTQVGLSGKGLRDTGDSLNLVLSYLLLLSYQRSNIQLPQLAIYLNSSAPSSKISLQPDRTEKTIPKINAALNKELNRRRIGSTTTTGASSSFYMSSASARLEAIEAIPATQQQTFWSAFTRLFKPESIKGLSRDGSSEFYTLPDEEGELMRLLDDEEDQMIGVDKSLNGFERYEKLSGHQIQWIVSTPSDPHGLKEIWTWIKET
ncbi:uncharacterized protein MELLADRAFT_101271 [Melampsora larici-populina 98AG31]|uniref:Signal recognition particle receptor subunit beta n=1 Tax=Melampsora larici-populina (strain 98AG31 / pathotype 3-4-7) TaxID=747676 RepID=F4R466_MELLP|nr:uncharacterized protein MELLADRAFT_101271 [Melampsora larici-populina 98AG31]EGG12751.1 hypothetical protein MELLADRAFT_101271 [Melampsora larici-populina 98AG31]